MSDRPALAVIPGGGPRYWRCDHCGRRAPWGHGWQWFGSLRDLDDRGLAGIKRIVCSDSCRDALEATRGETEAP